MRRILIGAAALVALATPFAFSSPAHAGLGLPDEVPAPCGGNLPCGNPEEKVDQVVDRVQRLCPRPYC